MNGPEALAALPPARRAELIYATARSELSNRLWRAALGDSDSANSASNPAGRPGLPLGSLVEMMGGGGSAQPGTAATGATAAGHPHHCCCCSHHHGDAAPGATPAAAARAVPSAPTITVPGTVFPQGGPADAVGEARGGLLALGSNAQFAPALARAAEATGVPAGAIAAIVDAEAARRADGSWNPLSRNPRSSAAGLGQFLSGTWQDMARTPGTWLNETAASHGWLDGQGRIRPQARSALLQLRYDPEASIRTVADFARLNLDRLESDGLRVRADPEALAKAAYLSHHLGLGDARRFLRGGLVPDRARTLLVAQIGGAAAEQRIARTGNATEAHREWLLAYIDRRIQPDRFAG